MPNDSEWRERSYLNLNVRSDELPRIGMAVKILQETYYAGIFAINVVTGPSMFYVVHITYVFDADLNKVIEQVMEGKVVEATTIVSEGTIVPAL